MLLGMASKRDVLDLLSRDELLTMVDLFGVEMPDRRGKDGIVDALVASRKAVLARALSDFSRDRLKDLCRGLGLDDSGREKTALIERLTGTTPAGTGNGNASPAPVGRTNGKQADAAPHCISATNVGSNYERLAGG
jgi:hypothetical protein